MHDASAAPCKGLRIALGGAAARPGRNAINYLMQSHTQTNLVLRDQIRFTSSEFLKSSRNKQLTAQHPRLEDARRWVGKSGGANRDRTGDLLLAKQALSQLSYGPALNWGRNCTYFP